MGSMNSYFNTLTGPLTKIEKKACEEIGGGKCNASHRACGVLCGPHIMHVAPCEVLMLFVCVCES